LIGEYVRAVNSEGAPVVATAWEQVTANECIDAASTALKQHKEFLNNFSVPMDATEAAELHATALYAAIRSYDERAEGKNAAREREQLQVKHTHVKFICLFLVEIYISFIISWV
jgi:hypothetical protein